MKPKKNTVTLILPPKQPDPVVEESEMKEAIATVVGDTPLEQKQEKTHTQMSSGQMISYEKSKIKRYEDRIAELKQSIVVSKKKIKALEQYQQLSQ
jgi:hypothetical protein